MVCDDVICFCKQKTAYEMRINDWSSDVCSSDLSTAKAKVGDNPVSYDQCSRHQNGPARATDRTGAFPYRGTPFTNHVKIEKFCGFSLYWLSLMQIGRASCRERLCQYV